MFVDDDEDIRNLVQSSVEKELNIPIEIAIFDNGEAAVKDSLETKYDLVITDYQLPGISGLELIDQIRRSKTNKTVPIIFISGFFAKKEITERYEDLENVLFINKPFEVSKLARKIRILLFSKY